MKFQCEACDRAVDYDPAVTLEAMPSGWRMHEISVRRFLLCSSCGHPAAFVGGISPHLKQVLRARYGIDITDAP